MEPRWIGPYVVVESLDKGRYKLKNSKTGKVLKNTYHGANLKIYNGKDKETFQNDDFKELKDTKFKITNVDKQVFDIFCGIGDKVDEEDDEELLDDIGDESIDGEGSDENENDDDKNDEEDVVEMASWQENKEKGFTPLTSQERRCMAERFGLSVVKPSFFAPSPAIKPPRRRYRTKGDGNCYFRAISYILTGSEKDHSFVRNLVIQHMNGPMKEQLQNYMSDKMENYLDKSGMVQDGVWATDA